MADLYARAGGEFLVNFTTAGAQTQPKVTQLGSGFIVTWTDASGTSPDTSGTAIRAQRYDEDGAKIGGEFVVNSTVVNSQNTPVVAELASGGFVISWTDGSEVRARVFGADGVPVANDFIANFVTSGSQTTPTVAALGTGFVMAWTGTDASFLGIKAQVFDAAGARVGSELAVNTGTANNQQTPVITSLASGGFAVVWHDNKAAAPTTNFVEMQIFNSDGTKLGGEISVSEASAVQPTVTELSSGNILVVWFDGSQTAPDTTGAAVSAKIYSPDGTLLVDKFLINTVTAGNQTEPTVAALPDGGFVVAWADDSRTDADKSLQGIKAQVFGGDGGKVGEEFLVNSEYANGQTKPSIAVLDSGGFVISWVDASLVGTDTSGSGIKAQVFEPTIVGPTDIALSGLQVSETHLANLPVASLSATGGVGGSFTFEIIEDSTDGAFGADGDKLVVIDNTKLDFETGQSATIKVRVTDSGGNSYEEEFTLAVTDSAIEQLYSAGAEQLANTATNQYQYGSEIARLESGGYVVTWSDNSGLGGDASGYSVRAQVYDADGAKAGGEVLVNQVTDGDQYETSVTGLSDGRFVVVWEDSSGDGNIKARIFGADGVADGPEFQVDPAEWGGSSYYPSVTALDDGGFAVLYHAGGVLAVQAFDGSGTPSGDLFAEDFMFDAEGLQITTLEDGRLALTWAGTRDGGIVVDEGGNFIEEETVYGIWTRIVDPAGTAVSETILVEPITVFEAGWATSITALDNGGFVCSWASPTGDGSQRSMMGQLFEADGTAVGVPFLLNTTTANQQHLGNVSALDGGGFIATWEDSSASGLDDNGAAVRGQIFDDLGNKVGSEFLINDATTGYQGNPDVTGIDGGGFAVSWTDRSQQGGDGSESGVKVRLFDRIILTENPTPSDDLVSATEDQPLVIPAADLLGNDSDPDGDSLTIASVSNPVGGTAVLSADGTSITFTPTSNFNGIASFTYTVADGFGGTATATVEVDVGAVNDAPTIVGDGTETLGAVDEDSADPAGDTVGNLFGGAFADIDSGDGFAGVAVVGSNATAAQGAWQYHDGTAWVSLAGAADDAAILLAPDAKVRFLPAADYTGTAPTLEVRLVDDSAGPLTTGEVVDLDEAGTGGTTRVSGGIVRLDTEVDPVNDAPAGADAALGQISEDAADPAGETVSSLFGGAFSDIDGDGLAGIAIVGNPATAAEGVWEYYDLGGWIEVGGVSVAEAAVLAGDTLIRFVPAPDFNGAAPPLSVHLIDDSAGPVMTGTGANLTTTGGTTRYSADPVALGQAVVAVNDPVSVSVGSGETVAEDMAVTVTGLSISDVDAALAPDGEYEVTLSAADGTLTLGDVTGLSFSDGDGSGDGAMTFSGTLAEVNAALATVSFTGAADFNGEASVTIEVSDADGEGGSGAATTDSDSVAITVTAVNDAPRPDLNGAGAGTGASLVYTENDAATPIAPNATVSDPDSADFDGGTLVVEISANGEAGDRLTIAGQGDDPGQIGVSGGTVRYGGIVIGTYTGGAGGSDPLEIGLNAAATPVAVQALLQRVSFASLSDDPSALARTITYTLTDNDGGSSSGTATAVVDLTAVDDPGLAVTDTNTTDEATKVTGNVLGNDSDPDSVPVVAAVNGDAAAVGVEIMLDSGALLTLNADGSYEYDPNGAFDELAEAGSGAVNERRFDRFSYALGDGSTALVVVKVTGIASGVHRLFGSAGNDDLHGTAGADTFRLERGGNDQALGMGGNDRFLFGDTFTADDAVNGGAGYDQIVLNGDYAGGVTLGDTTIAAVELITLLGGHDYALTSADANVAADQTLVVDGSALGSLDRLIFDGSDETDGRFRLSGGAGADRLTGGDGDDVIIGHGGADEMTGGKGDDIYHVGEAGDQVVEQANGGTDTVKSYIDYVLGLEVENLRLFGAARTGTGNARGNSILGSAGGDTLNGLDGDDLLAGGNGADTLNGGNGGDQLSGGTSTDTLNGDAGEDRLAGGSGADILNGGADNDKLIGGEGNDVLNGGAGDDVLVGGANRDALTGGAGADLFVFSNADKNPLRAQADSVTDFNRAEGDRINLAQIDARTGTAGNDGFSFVGTAAFTGQAGELRYEVVNGSAILQGDTDGDKSADFFLKVDQITTIAAADLIV
jgi:Ca2+-binding RTX toxin-like protein